MAIPAAVLLKGGLGLGVLGAGATGVYYLSNKAPVVDTPLLTSKYDDALIEFLNKGDAYDIVFDVKKGANNSESDFANTDPIFDNNSNPVTVRAKVSVTGGNNTSENFKNGANKASVEELGQIATLNNGTWTWSCEFSFSKANDATQSAIKDEFKSRIWKDNKGLFGMLKKKLHNYSNESNQWTKQEIKDVKKSFIKQCAAARGEEKNKEVNSQGHTLSGNTINANVGTFEFVDGTGTNEGSSLVPKDKTKFDEWFKPEYGTKEFKA